MDGINPSPNVSEPEDYPWADDPQDLTPSVGESAKFPTHALPKAMRECAAVIQRCTQAPDAIIGSSLLAAASLAAQAHADVQLPHGQVSPISLFVVSVAESGERKSAVDNLVLRPHALFEKAKHDEHALLMAAYKALDKAEQEAEGPPREAVFISGDPTFEGMTKLLIKGLPSLGVFSAEGGRFMGGYGMSDDAALRTAAGLSMVWDGSPIDRVRSGDGAIKLYGRRVAVHLMAQPRAAFNWLSNPTLRDQGLFSRCLVGYPASTAGTRLFRDEQANNTPEYAAYCEAMNKLLQPEWSMNEMGELTPRILTLTRKARTRWIQLHDEVEVAIPTDFAGVRGFASKAAENATRIAGVLELVRNPAMGEISEEGLDSAAELLQWYVGEAVRLSGVQPLKDGVDKAVTLWSWLKMRGKRQICLAELTQYGPAKLRTAKVMRDTMAMLVDHYRARPMLDPMEWEGRQRREGWEIRL
ncbi:YfjI family protein [Polaromonas sp.]|uniref:YfjI family protein n=1 Tax=Polaromonas sp. TaxID=1869339 RepID=UPI0024873C9A|nr:YfjI family protein [Polaromonas sp.]MDI1339357.1 YfjI family protein [Polaromonas sp.]